MKKKHSTVKLLKYFFIKYPKKTIIAVGLLLLSAIFETLGVGALLPLISLILDDSSGQNNQLSEVVLNIFTYIDIDPSVSALLVTIVITISLKAFIIFQAMRYITYVSADVAKDMRIDLMKALMEAEWKYFSSLSVGKVSNIISLESARAGHCYLLAGRTIAALLQACVYLFIAFVVSWKISLLAIVGGVFIGFILKSFIKMARAAGQDMSSSTDSMLIRFNESLSGVKPLKAMGQEKRYLSHLKSDASKVMMAQKKQSLSAQLLQIMYEPLAVFLLAIGLYYILTFTDTPVPLVLLLAFLFYRLLTQASLLQNFYQNMIQNEPAVWNVLNSIENATLSVDTNNLGEFPTLKSSILIDNISMSYDEKFPIFNEFSAQIPAHSFCVLFGPSGVGKTTLVDMIIGLSKVDQGRILIDNVDMNNIDTVGWRNMIGYVPQETFLFHDTIKTNITLGDESFSDKDVLNSLEQANAMEFINEMSKGIDTIVGERGGKLSGGQRQRIALARALIRNPSLLILDEATTGLDSKSESLIFDFIQKNKSNITIIAVSHDIKILNLADHVINLEKIDDL